MKKWLWILPLLAFSGLAQAHIGAEPHSHLGFVSGVLHPLTGFDHLLAMVAVGLWSARSFTGKARLLAPLAFVGSLVAGALAAHISGVEWAFSETLIAGSVVAFAALILLPNIQKWAGFGLIIATGLVHGWAHGAEATGSVFALYVAGFTLSTAALHLFGVWAGTQLLRFKSEWHWRAISAGIAAYGVLLLSGVA